MALRKEKLHKYTQNYPTERKDYPSTQNEKPAEIISLDKKRAETVQKKRGYQPVQGDPEEGGKISPDEAERISSDDLPS